MVIPIAALLLSPGAFAGVLVVPPQDNTNLQIRTITLKHKLATDSPTAPWRSGRVSPRAVLIKFEIAFEQTANVPQPPDKLPLRVELKRLCRLRGNGGNVLTNRFQNFFTSHQEDVTVDQGKTTSIVVDVHCTTCPPPVVCQFPNGDGDHLGEGPYEALIIAGQQTALTSDTSAQTTSAQIATTTPPLLIHSKYFNTCVSACRGDALLETAAEDILKGSKRQRSQNQK